MKLKPTRHLWAAIVGFFVLNCTHVLGQASVPLGVTKPEGSIALSIAAVLDRPSVLAFTITNGSQHIVETAGLKRGNNSIAIITPNSRLMWVFGVVVGVKVSKYPVDESSCLNGYRR